MNDNHPTDDPATVWNRRYQDSTADAEPQPAQVLAENLYLLPPTGRALDVACGLGNNALALARAGLETHAWDISAVAVERLRASAAARGLTLRLEVRDVLRRPPPPAGFEVITVSRFLERTVMADLVAALTPGGLLFYQTFTRNKVTAGGPDNPDFLLADNELLTLCRGLKLRAYRENDRLGNPHKGLRNMAWLIGEKP